MRCRHARVTGWRSGCSRRDCDVDDVVQDTFVGAFAALDRLQDPQAFQGLALGDPRAYCGQAYPSATAARAWGMGRASLATIPTRWWRRPCHKTTRSSCGAFTYTAERLPASVRVPLLLQRVEGSASTRSRGSQALATVKRRVAEAESALRASFLYREGR